MTASTHFIDTSYIQAFRQRLTSAFELAAQALRQASPSDQKEFTMTSPQKPLLIRDFSTGIDQNILLMAISRDRKTVTAQLITNPEKRNVAVHTSGPLSPHYDTVITAYKDSLIIGITGPTFFTVTPEPMKAITAWLQENNVSVLILKEREAT
ncbi:hypothetical protein LOD44_09995 [Xylella fastidiosa subsp. multiplex]|uniref:Uncharacterized protein n=1 Tax=Xylella fastidiosa subsp. multiplex TaxID=644357 RepID=A0A9Q4MH50_XYLFS|nr:hypothetical protein [Xylella fastidiosa]ERI59267.1 hypothetical protein M233_10525 [Xylella fastidiosa subsp. multiplex Griffin-1]ACA11644.1 conserved hypothetical protein [Xylella fastidiosa M12]KAJ4852210.1 hypothetical protein XYFPCFBP8418_010055 [Xylella fastidiosa subsp. multiplex]MBE0269882.1 hypothetical protein [Xylella fastidiosa subsp. multiplex]MBE0276482.1 hypothetical protein [Xylella fastidiosa subsp. multiplex]